jgi:cell division protein FtsA
MRHRNKLVCSLDIGCAGAKALIAGTAESGGLQILGVGEAACGGMNQGMPVNMDETVEAIMTAVESAEHSASTAIESVVLGMSGVMIHSENRQGHTVITRNPSDPESSLIQRHHLDHVLEQASREDSLPIDRQIVHSLPTDYLVDGVSGVRNPVGINGLQLECIVNQVSAPASVLENLRRCVDRAGLRVQALHLSSRAASEVLLSPDEKDLGVLVMDVGAGSIDLLAYKEGHMQHAWTLPFGGGTLTKDISVAYRMPSDESERIKIGWGSACQESIEKDACFEVEALGAEERHKLTRTQLCGVLQPRMEEVVEHIEQELEAKDLRWLLGAGVVLTGGSSQLHGLDLLIRNRLAMPARIGKMQHVTGLDMVSRNPAWSVAAGLSQLALQSKEQPVTPMHRLFGWMRDKVAL